uniref:G-protein coupled receptors family 1 profile domain-containing protein n=1 Tax=Chrysotila carterae TaxID=13221 RepID=A0A7S4B5E8_CHRCT|mmetsp:Transcript_12179/g.26035  ORF Transcript_12179/g.26035 Transcript_12179/m.26035 type:complete len:384 (+) Transcript_12179:188-1339(+)
MSNTITKDELPENPSRFDYIRVRPGDDDLHKMWSAWSAISALVSAGCLIVLLSIGTSSIRKNHFNVIIWFVVFPDFIFSFCCIFTCAINAAFPSYSINEVRWMCEWQSIFCIIGFTASPWMNAYLGYEVYRLLYANRWAITYEPPSSRRMYCTVAILYSWSLFVALWTLIPFLPHEANAGSGLACFPLEYDTGSSLFFWLVFTPCFLLIPLFYIFILSIRAWQQGLLAQASDKARPLAYFYMRIVLVFVVFWVPSVTLLYVVPMSDPWIFWAGGTWSHLQGLGSSMMCLSKPDILQAAKKLPLRIVACCRRKELAKTEHATSSMQTSTYSKRTPASQGARLSIEQGIDISPDASHMGASQYGVTSQLGGTSMMESGLEPSSRV